MAQTALFKTPSRKARKLLPIIYQPAGAANEYGELAANLYSGCHHGCVYCYVPAVLRMPKTAFHSNIGTKQNALERLEKSCAKYAGMDRTVFLSFTTDPYQPIMDWASFHTAVIAKLNEHGCTYYIKDDLEKAARQ